MIAIIFIILLIATLFAWLGKREWGISIFLISSIISIIFFLHDVTTKTNLSL